MKTQTAFTSGDIADIAKLANIPVNSDEEQKLAHGFNATIAVVDTLNQIDTSHVPPTHQVTGLTNIFREDVVDEARMFSQEEALLNAKDTHEGYFMVEQILEGD